MKINILLLLFVCALSNVKSAEFEKESSSKYCAQQDKLRTTLDNHRDFDQDELRTIQEVSEGINDSWNLTFVGNDVKYILKKEARPAFIETVKRLAPANLTPIQKRHFISSIAGIDFLHYPLFTRMTERLCLGLQGEDWLSVAEGLAVSLKSNTNNISNAESDFISSIQTLCDKRSSNDKRYIMIALSEIESLWWNPFAKYAINHDFFNEIPLSTFFHGVRKEKQYGKLKTKEDFVKFINKCWIDTKKSYEEAMHYKNQSEKATKNPYFYCFFRESKKLSQHSLENEFMTMEDMN